MAAFTATTRKVIAAASLALVAGLAVPGSASAKTWCNPMSGICYYKSDPVLVGDWLKKGYKPSYGYGGGYGKPGWGYGAAALGGMAVGLVAAGAASASTNVGQASEYAGECYFVRRRAVDEDGNMYIRRIRVCD